MAKYIDNIRSDIVRIRERGGSFTASASFMNIAWCNQEIKQKVKEYFSNLNYIVHDPPTLDTLKKAVADERNDLSLMSVALSLKPHDRWFLIEFSNIPETSTEKNERLEKEIAYLSRMILSIKKEIV